MIVSRQNPKLKAIRRLRRGLDEALLLEGPNLVNEALALDLPLETVIATTDFLRSPAGDQILEALDRPPLEVSPRLLRELTDVDAPQGILAVARLERPSSEEIPRRTGGLYVFAEGIQDPGNLGALARSVEAAGGVALALAVGSVHPNHPRALRASAGSLLRLPVARHTSIEALAAALKELTPGWIALAPRGGMSLYEADLTGTLVLAVGAEGGGLSTATLERCERLVSIPIEPAVESLNASVAAAVALFECRRQRAGRSRSQR